MSTSLSGANNSVEVESLQRFSVITRQTASSTNGITNPQNGSGSVLISRATSSGCSNIQQQHSLSTNTIFAGTRQVNFSNKVQNVFLLDLPMEVLDKIFSYVSYKKVGQLRVVSHKMNEICMSILNSTFSKLINQMVNRFQSIKAKMPRRESARRNHPLACECDIVETCYMRLSLLQMTFGKHIERRHCCFFAGGIIDEVHNVLNYIQSTTRLEKPYRVTDELFDLSTMAMEYFKDHIEPNLPGIAYFNKDFFKLPSTKRPSSSSMKVSSELSDTSLPSPPQSNMVLRKGIRKIKQGMKMYNNQLSMLRNELRNCKRRSLEQGKQIAEQQKVLAEQQKQTMEYATRLDENDKKNEEMSRKFSTLLQELNKCKSELQYWRSKSPATQMCTSCGQKISSIITTEDNQALVSQGIKPEDDIPINIDDADESDNSSSNISLSNEFVFPNKSTTAKLIQANIGAKKLKRQHTSTSNTYAALPGYNHLQCNTVKILNSEINANEKRNTILPFTSSNSLNDLTLDKSQQNIINVTTGDSTWPEMGERRDCYTEYPPALFYGTNEKFSKTGRNSVTMDSHSLNEKSNVLPNECAAINTDVTSISLLKNNEIKKARRVQKHSRLLNINNGRRK